MHYSFGLLISVAMVIVASMPGVPTAVFVLSPPIATSLILDRFALLVLDCVKLLIIADWF